MSSDAFSFFGKNRKIIFLFIKSYFLGRVGSTFLNEDVRQASIYLKNELIDKFIRENELLDISGFNFLKFFIFMKLKKKKNRWKEIDFQNSFVW